MRLRLIVMLVLIGVTGVLAGPSPVAASHEIVIGMQCDRTGATQIVGTIHCPGKHDYIALVNSKGGVEHRTSIVHRGLHPAQVAAGVVDQHGGAKYPGLHSLRHFYASWCINRRVDGGLELPLKVVQARLGHASIQMTADTYGHLFPRGDDGSELAAAERAFIG